MPDGEVWKVSAGGMTFICHSRESVERWTTFIINKGYVPEITLISGGEQK